MSTDAVLDAEQVAYWYLRLNGFLLLKNFLVHGDRAGRTRTDIDVLGVRFKHREEHLAQAMHDDRWIEDTSKTIIVFCEAKSGPHDFNNSWANRELKTMESFLALVGVLPKDQWSAVSEALYRDGKSEPNEDLLITTLLLHHDPYNRVKLRWPNARRLQIEAALQFIHGRFGAYHNLKTQHAQWEPSGHALWESYCKNRYSEYEFVKEVMQEIG